MVKKLLAKEPGYCRRSFWLDMYEFIDVIASNSQIEAQNRDAVDPQLNTLFDEYVHDSHAGFYIAGPRNDFEKNEFYKAAKEKAEVKIMVGPETGNSLANDFEKELVENGVEKFPLMTDERSSDLRTELLGATQSLIGQAPCRPSTRREAFGHVKMRWLLDSGDG